MKNPKLRKLIEGAGVRLRRVLERPSDKVRADEATLDELKKLVGPLDIPVEFAEDALRHYLHTKSDNDLHRLGAEISRLTAAGVRATTY